MPANKGTPPEMITPEEMAPRMGTSADNIRMMMRAGVFPIGIAHNPTGRQWVYRIIRAEFEALMAGRVPSNQRRLARMVAEELVNMKMS